MITDDDAKEMIVRAYVLIGNAIAKDAINEFIAIHPPELADNVRHQFITGVLSKTPHDWGKK